MSLLEPLKSGLIGNWNDPSLSTLGAIVKLGMPQSLSLISVDGKNPWILDSGDTNHLISSSESFVSSIPCVVMRKSELQMVPWPPLLERGKIFPLKGYPYEMCCMFSKFLIICYL